MKKIMQMALSGMVMMSYSSFAKSESGVYLSASDFINRKPAYETECKIHLNNSIWDLPYITVTSNGKKMRLQKDEIFGYIDKEHNTHRFYKGNDYLVEESGNINIYLLTEKVSQSKGYKIVKRYYFSKDESASILPLTFNNLKSVYSANEKFLTLLNDAYNNDDISGYDKIHNTYRVNYIYSVALK
jgi:hypothetical protein